jgi:hypothetical protein
VAGLKISELPFQGIVNDDDLIVIVHNGETSHTTVYQLRQIMGGGSGTAPIIENIPATSLWESPGLFPTIVGATNKYIITIDNGVASHAFEAAVTVHNGEPHFVKYGMLGGSLMYDVDFIDVGGMVSVKINNFESTPVTIKVQQL